MKNNYIKTFNNLLPRQGVLTNCKPFVRQHLDCGDIIFEQTNHESLCQTIKNIQYKATLAITSAIKETSKEKLYEKLGLETLKFKH